MGETDNLTTFMCRMSWKYGKLNLLEPSGPHQACYVIPLPFYFSLAGLVSGKLLVKFGEKILYVFKIEAV